MGRAGAASSPTRAARPTSGKSAIQASARASPAAKLEVKAGAAWGGIGGPPPPTLGPRRDSAGHSPKSAKSLAPRARLSYPRGMAESRRLPIALIQMQVSEDPETNLGKAVARVDEAARDGAKLICLPELFRSRYFCQSEESRKFELAES